MREDQAAAGGLIRRALRKRRWAYIDLLAILIGVVGGVGAIVFQHAIDLVSGIFFSGIDPAAGPGLSVMLYPVIGGLIVGPIVFILAPEAKGQGVSRIIESVLVGGGRIRRRAGFLLILSSAVTIGSGGSAGREGPIAQIGGSFGSLVGQIFRLSSRDLKLLTVCGVAAGVAADRQEFEVS